MKDKANKGYWQRLAKIYAPLMESDKKFYNAICGYIRDYLKSDMNVLELACGTGQLSFPLSDCTNSWTATDFSENMIKQAKRRGTTEKLSFCVADATALSYENENFDCVVISNALHIMPEPEKAMQEIRRVLKKDGILYAPTFLWAEKKSSGLRKRLMSITGFKAYKEWNKENFCEEQGIKLRSVEDLNDKEHGVLCMDAFRMGIKCKDDLRRYSLEELENMCPKDKRLFVRLKKLKTIQV